MEPALTHKLVFRLATYEYDIFGLYDTQACLNFALCYTVLYQSEMLLKIGFISIACLSVSYTQARLPTCHLWVQINKASRLNYL